MTVPAVQLSREAPVVRVRTDVVWLPERFRRRPTRIRVRFRTSAGERRLFRKKKRLPVAEWASKYRKITYGPLKGSYYDPSYMPHMAGMMLAAAHPGVAEVVNCKAPQTGGSAGWETFVAYRADLDPVDTLIVYPDRDTASKRCKDYLGPMFTNSPRLRTLMTGLADDMASLRIKLQTMLIYMAWAGSVTSIGNVSAGVLIVDELDKCPDQPSKKEAGFEGLVSERTSAFDRFGSIKIWNSTPTSTPSKIARRLANCDVIFDFHVPCPDCQHIQLMEFDRIDFNGIRDPEQMERERQARYICPGCGAAWDDRTRDQALKGGRWYARNPEVRKALEKAGKWIGQPTGESIDTCLAVLRPAKVGFHAPAWISPQNTLAKCAAAFLRGLRDSNEMIYFVTQIKAEEYTHWKKQRKEEAVLALRDDRPEGLVPGDGQVCALVCGSDTQDNGHYYWIAAVGWGLHPRHWLVRSGFVEGEQELLDVVFATEYRDMAGNVYPVQLMVKDAMGHRTSEVYDLCLRMPGRIVPYKGASGRRASPWTKTVVDRYPGTTKPIPGGVQLYTCDSHHYKDLLAAKMAVKIDDPGGLLLHGEADEELASHLCAEVRDERGLWDNPGKRANHLWDCAFMALIAPDLLQLKFRSKPEGEQAVAAKKTVKPNPYTGGRNLFGRQ